MQCANSGERECNKCQASKHRQAHSSLRAHTHTYTCEHRAILFRTDNFGNVCLRRCCVDGNPIEGMLLKTTMTLVFQRFPLFYLDGSLPSLLLLLLLLPPLPSPPSMMVGFSFLLLSPLLLLSTSRINVRALCVLLSVCSTMPPSFCYLAKICRHKNEMSKNKHSKDMYKP